MMIATGSQRLATCTGVTWGRTPSPTPGVRKARLLHGRREPKGNKAELGRSPRCLSTCPHLFKVSGARTAAFNRRLRERPMDRRPSRLPAWSGRCSGLCEGAQSEPPHLQRPTEGRNPPGASVHWPGRHPPPTGGKATGKSVSI